MKAPLDVPRPRDYLTMLRRAWLAILLATLLSAGAAVAATLLHKPGYVATARLFATVAGDPGTFAAYAGGMGANARIPTYLQLATSTQVTQRVIDDLELSTTPEELATHISGTWEPFGVSRFGRPVSALLQLQVTASDPKAAVEIVNAVAGNLVVVSRELKWTQSKPTDEIQYTGAAAELVPVDQAKAAQRQRPSVLRPALVGGGIGLAVSVLIMLAAAISRDAVATRGQLNHIVKTARQINA